MARKDWSPIRAKTNGVNFDSVRSRLIALPKEIDDEVVAPFLDKVAFNAADSIRYTILSMITRTGEARVEAGGNGPGRVDEGDMFEAVTYKTKKLKNGYSIRVGWLSGTPGYAIFQEQGVSNRKFEAMHSIDKAKQYMLNELDSFKNGKFWVKGRYRDHIGYIEEEEYDL